MTDARRERVIYFRPDAEPTLGMRYRDECNRTGRCPGCEVEVTVRQIRPGVSSVSFAHDDDCPVVMETPMNPPPVGQ